MSPTVPDCSISTQSNFHSRATSLRPQVIRVKISQDIRVSSETFISPLTISNDRLPSGCFQFLQTDGGNLFTLLHHQLPIGFGQDACECAQSYLRRRDHVCQNNFEVPEETLHGARFK